jgi:hypothetical protein
MAAKIFPDKDDAYYDRLEVQQHGGATAYFLLKFGEEGEDPVRSRVRALVGAALDEPVKPEPAARKRDLLVIVHGQLSLNAWRSINAEIFRWLGGDAPGWVDRKVAIDLRHAEVPEDSGIDFFIAGAREVKKAGGYAFVLRGGRERVDPLLEQLLRRMMPDLFGKDTLKCDVTPMPAKTAAEAVGMMHIWRLSRYHVFFGWCAGAFDDIHQRHMANTRRAQKAAAKDKHFQAMMLEITADRGRHRGRQQA